MDTKVCTGCDKDLPLDDYYYISKARGTRRAKCKSCYRIATNASDARRRQQKELANGSSNDKTIQYITRVAEVLSLLHDTTYHVDHIIPLSKGGTHHEGNLQILTEQDNKRKYNKLDTDIKGLTWYDILKNKAYYNGILKILY